MFHSFVEPSSGQCSNAKIHGELLKTTTTKTQQKKKKSKTKEGYSLCSITDDSVLFSNTIMQFVSEFWFGFMAYQPL